jgi:hypothetical protein
MVNNEFYRGVLFELEKLSQENPAQRDATPAGNSNDLGGSAPKPSFMGRLGNAAHNIGSNAGYYAGRATGAVTNSLVPSGISSRLGQWGVNRAAHNFNPSHPSDSTHTGNFLRGMIKSDTGLKAGVNEGIANKSMGLAGYDENSGGLSFTPGNFLQRAGRWIGDNPGKAALGAGGLALLTMLATRGGGNQQPQPVQQGMMPQPRQTPSAVPQFL